MNKWGRKTEKRNGAAFFYNISFMKIAKTNKNTGRKAWHK